MDFIEAAILRTILYADVFNFPLTVQEIHHFLIYSEAVSYDLVADTLQQSQTLQSQLEIVDDYVFFNGRKEIISIRQKREAASKQLWDDAVRYGRWLARLPFVRMVALTGSLAVRNAADGDDDLDYILVTQSHRVWIARAFSIMVVRLVRLRGIEVCPNYVLAENALSQTQEDIFMAHEVAQMIPLYGQTTYTRFRDANVWVDKQLPNADHPFYDVPEYNPNPLWRAIKEALEFLLGGNPGSWIEQWEYRRKLQRFASDLQKPHSSALLDDSHIKGHFDDHGHPVLKRYYERLQEYQLEPVDEPMSVTGD